MSRRVLVAGVGNVFFCDDGFGVEVVRRMGELSWSRGVLVRDYGIRGLHLVYELLEPLELLVVVDALGHGLAPGTLTLLEPSLDTGALEASNGHGMNLPVVFDTVRALGGELPPVRLVGCEPASLREGMELSPEVAAAIPRAIDMIRTVIAAPSHPQARDPKVQESKA